MKTSLAVIFALLSITIGTAQDQEYAITLKNDTIYGKVSIYNYEGSGQQVTVKKKKQKTVLKVHEVKLVSTKIGELHTLNIRNQYQLAKVEKSGYLSYYKFSGNPNNTSLSFETPLLIKKTREQIEITNIGFKKQVQAFLSDCESVQVKFENGDYRRNDLLQIIDDYNQCIEDNTIAMNKKFEVNAKHINQADQIKGIKEAVNSSSVLIDKEEIIEMLNDLQAKIKSGKKVPSYLITALKEKLASEPKLIESLLQAAQ